MDQGTPSSSAHTDLAACRSSGARQRNTGASLYPEPRAGPQGDTRLPLPLAHGGVQAQGRVRAQQDAGGGDAPVGKGALAGLVPDGYHLGVSVQVLRRELAVLLPADGARAHSVQHGPAAAGPGKAQRGQVVQKASAAGGGLQKAPAAQDEKSGTAQGQEQGGYVEAADAGDTGTAAGTLAVAGKNGHGHVPVQAAQTGHDGGQYGVVPGVVHAIRAAYNNAPPGAKQPAQGLYQPVFHRALLGKASRMM